MIFQDGIIKYAATAVVVLSLHLSCISCPTPSRHFNYRFFSFNLMLQSSLNPKTDLFLGISAMQENGSIGKSFTRLTFNHPYFNLRYMMTEIRQKKNFQKIYLGAYAQWPLSFSETLIYRDAAGQVIKGLYVQHLCRIRSIRFSSSLAYQSNNRNDPYLYHQVSYVHSPANQRSDRLIPVVHFGATVKNIPKEGSLKNFLAGRYVYTITIGTELYFKNTSVNLSHNQHVDGGNNYKKGAGYFSGTITYRI